MSTILVPQFDLPFRIVGSTAAVVEQDTLAEITDCVEAICRCPVGFRLELPTFGIPDQSFTLGGADPDPIIAAVQTWEPRATSAATADNTTLDVYVTTVLVSVEGGT
jgi:hypothetical protein